MQNKAHVSLILDKSGSMSDVREKTISGVNEYFQTLKNDANTDYTVDLVLFDDSSKQVYRNRPLSEVKALSNEDYVPNHGTALYDAACDTLLAREAGEATKWIVVIMTDGEENSSKKYSEQQFADYVKLLKGTGWVQFVFLGANQDSFAKAQKWNFNHSSIANFNATPRGIEKNFMMAASATMSSANLDWTAQGQTTTDSAFFSKAQQDDLADTK